MSEAVAGVARRDEVAGPGRGALSEQFGSVSEAVAGVGPADAEVARSWRDTPGADGVSRLVRATSGEGEDGPDAEDVTLDLDLPLITDDDLAGALEAVLLVVDTPVGESALATAVGRPAARIRQELELLASRYAESGSGIELRESGGGWRYYTRDRFAPVVERFVLDGQQSRLSRAALESLAVIAYRQPVTRARVSAVRGVNVDGVIRTLTARGLIEEVGTDPETGGLRYRTTELFLDRMGLSSLEELPDLGPLLPEIDGIDDD